MNAVIARVLRSVSRLFVNIAVSVALFAVAAGGCTEGTEPRGGDAPSPAASLHPPTDRSRARPDPADRARSAAREIRIVDPNDAPIDQVVSRFLAESDVLVSESIGGPDGRVRLPEPLGGVRTVRISKPGWRTITRKIDEFGTAAGVPSVTLRPNTSLVVRAVGSSREPVSGVRIEAAPAGVGRAGDVALSAVTGDDGTVAFLALEEGRWRVSATAVEMAVDPPREVSVRSGLDEEVRFRVSRLTSAPVLVVDRNGLPMAHAALVGVGEFSTPITGSDGRGAVPVAPSQLPPRVTVIAQDGRNYTASLREGSVPPTYDIGDEIPQRPLAEASLAGVVTSASGRPLRGVVTVRTRGADGREQVGSAVSRADGSFRFFDLPAGSAYVQARLTEGHGFHVGPRSPTSGERTIELPCTDARLVIVRSAVIEGTLRDFVAAPVARAPLRFFRIDDGGLPPAYASATATTGPSGEFRVEGMEPGTYRILDDPLQPDCVPGAVDALVEADAGPIDLRCAEPREIRCTVVDDDGQAVPGLHVYAVHGTDRDASRVGACGEDGVARLRGLRSDRRYTLQVPLLGAPPVTGDDPGTSGTSEVRLRMPPDTSLRIRVDVPAGAVRPGRRIDLIRVSDGLRAGAITDRDGRAVLRWFPPGEWEVRLGASPDLEADSVAIVFPGIRDVVLDGRRRVAR